MPASNDRAFAQFPAFPVRIGRGRHIPCLLGIALFIAFVEFASCQVDPPRFGAQVPLANRFVVSKNQLLTPGKAEKAIDRAREELLRGHLESAQKEIRRALDICPHCALASTIQGLLYLQSNNLVGSANAFQRAIDEDPTSGAAFLGLAIAYNNQGRFREAIVPLDRAAPLIPDSWLLHFESAIAHLNIGEGTVSVTQITLAERLSGSDPDKLSRVALVQGVARIQLKEFASAETYLEEAIRRDPGGVVSTMAKERLAQLRVKLSRAQ